MIKNQQIKKYHANLVKIVTILSDGQYHPGSAIGKVLDLTRSAVWKVIKKLKHYGIRIDAVKGKGYALLDPLCLLELKQIKKLFAFQPEKKIDWSIFESIASTNDYLKNFRQQKLIKVCLAEQQTRGKGRLNREWYSPFGRNIYLSCLYPFQKDISELAGLSLVVSLAVIRALKDHHIKDKLFVKWPNDILFDHKKLAGSLIELQAESHGTCQAIIGVGVNVNMQDDKQFISQAWTSIQKIIGHEVNRNELCAHLLNHLFTYLHQFETHGFSYFIDEWITTDCLTHQTVTLKNINQQVTGKVIGVNEQGHLLLMLQDGAVRAFSSGDTSVVKI